MTRDARYLLLNSRITLKELTLLLIDLPLVESFRSAIGTRRRRQALLVRWVDRDGAWGIGECSCRPDPYFNGEFLKGALAVVRDYLFPQLPVNGSVAEVIEATSRVRGWHFTVASVLDSLSDLLRRKGIADLLDQWPQEPQGKIPVGVSLPLFDTSDEAVARVEEAVSEGYRRVKMKVSPQMNLTTLQAVRESFPELALGLDANGSCRPRDLPFIRELETLNPEPLEQPFAPERLDLSAELKRQLPRLRICLDESINGLGCLFAAHHLSAMDELNLKPGRVGGPFKTLEILDYCHSHDLPVWVGGMFESGVGRAANLRVAARLPKATAHDLSPSRRYFAVDVVQHPVEMDDQGYVHFVDQRPVALDETALERLCRRRIELKK